MNRAVATFVLVVGVASASRARAGYETGTEVVIQDHTAYGTLGTVANASDDLQYIGCGVVGWPGNLEAVCWAQDIHQVLKGCTSKSLSFVSVARAVGADSSVLFSWNDSGECTNLTSDNSSRTPPKLPLKQ
jgi:hypothetical protein